MLVTVLTMITLTALMIALNALYVAGEFAAVSARKSRIEQLASDNNRLAKMILPVLKDHHKLDNYIAASQVGITISSVVLGIYGQQQIAPAIAPWLAKLPIVNDIAAAGVSTTLVLILLTTLQVVLGELVPKSVALQFPEQIALGTAVPMKWSADYILKPLIILLNGSGTAIMRLLGIQTKDGHKHVHSPEEVKYLITQSHQAGLLDEQEHDLLDSAFRFGKLRAGDIIISRTQMVAAEVNTSIDDILRLAATADYTRIPIYEGDLDHIIGFVHLKELFQRSYEDDSTDVRSILRDVTFILETSSLNDVWNTLDDQQSYLAIVFDEYGGTTGMITREDLIEELFGDVQDEFDHTSTEAITVIGEQQYRVDGDISLINLNDALNIHFESSDAYTLGGFFINRLGHMPKIGDKLIIDDVQIKVTALEQRRITALQLTLPDSADDAQPTQQEEQRPS